MMLRLCLFVQPSDLAESMREVNLARTQHIISHPHNKLHTRTNTRRQTYSHLNSLRKIHTGTHTHTHTHTHNKNTLHTPTPPLSHTENTHTTTPPLSHTANTHSTTSPPSHTANTHPYAPPAAAARALIDIEEMTALEVVCAGKCLGQG